jgi:endoribonuclease Dicer
MTANTALAAICVANGLHQHIRNVPPTEMSAMTAYVARVDKAREEDQTQAMHESRRPGQYWVGLNEPKVRLIGVP